ncbi:MAG: CBS domain-containing protein [Actinomycetota bacterium]|nr:CBS domain-containing protein [Actinomycetota bacterium]
MTIRELVSGAIVEMKPTDTLRKAAELMKESEVGSIAVEVDGALEGIFTERDVLNAVAQFADLDRDPISNWMTSLPDTFGPEMSVDDAADWMLATGYRHLPVVDEMGKVLGMVSIKDVLWAITDPTTE